MMRREERALVLDYLPMGKAGEASREPVAQIIGKSHFTLLEVVVRRDQKLSLLEEIYIGEEARDKVDHIKWRVAFNELTSTAQRECENAVNKIVTEREKDFVAFFNNAPSLSIRLHSLELLPNIGRKHFEAIVSEREKKPFESFEEMHKRLSHLGNAAQIITSRVMQELRGEEKFYLFVKPMSQERRY
jgi:putative nucleotide binding protein